MREGKKGPSLLAFLSGSERRSRGRRQTGRAGSRKRVREKKWRSVCGAVWDHAVRQLSDLDWGAASGARGFADQGV